MKTWKGICLIIIVLTSFLTACQQTPKVPEKALTPDQIAIAGVISAATDAYNKSAYDKWKAFFGPGAAITVGKQLVTTDEDEIIGNIMNKEVIAVNTYDDREDVAKVFKKYDEPVFFF